MKMNSRTVLALGIMGLSLNQANIYPLDPSSLPLEKGEAGAHINTEVSPKAMIAGQKAREHNLSAIEKNDHLNLHPIKFDIAHGFSKVVEKAVLAVVNVSTTQILEEGRFGSKNEGTPFSPGSPFEDFFRDFFDFQSRARKVQSLGSGFIIQSDDSSAIIVTNYHVIADAKKIMVFLHDMTELEASVLAADERTDIALLKIKTHHLPEDKRKLPTLQWADYNTAKVGDWVLAIGNPFGLGSTVTKGIISNLSRDIIRKQDQLHNYGDDFIQHDAAINMGNSGGPLLSLEGKVIAVNTAIYSPSGGSVGVGFGIPSSVAQDTVRQLLEFGRTKRGWLGVRFQPITNAIAESLGLGRARGDIISSVTPDSPAAKAGIEPGDIILEFDGKEIDNQTKLPRLVGAAPIGKTIKVKVWRKGKVIDLDLVLGEFQTALDQEKHPAPKKPKASPQDTIEILGIKVTVLTPVLKERFKLGKEATGVFVMKIDVNSTAMELGLKTGDIIGAVNQKAVTKPEEFAKAIEEAKMAKYKNVLLSVIRNDELFYVPLKLEE